ncbi:MAG: UDP-N-acetylmuramoyl-tripeptide--D-alanyl-D-alanine ligase [Oscillospiraceae bacterium]|jgi:UDP-N-acetylmuramoyl-tripeptide--D-alanyl-D-alanine ligase|nr:UDP-N-acetylmuramoyl-tripeptide--D-alanyl-D-alanine ligase [Oscillospiraceae bacterium]
MNWWIWLIVCAVIALCYAFDMWKFAVNANMFQLNSYKPEVHKAWLKKNQGFMFRQTHGKTPLKWTARVKRMLAAYIIVSIPLFWLFPEKLLLIANSACQPIEKSINLRYKNNALKLLAEAKVNGLKVIGITGSYGKTSVKFFLASLLSAKYNVLATPNSFNTPLGVIRTINEQLRPVHNIFIVEMGARNVGDVKELCDLVQPDLGVITSIGEAHLEFFGSLENTLSAKFELADSLPAHGTVFLNWDNDLIRNRVVNTCRTSRFGVENENAGFNATAIKINSRGSSFSIGNVRFDTKLIGRHNVLNLAAAIGVAETLGVSVDRLPQYVARIEPVPHRLQLLGSGERLVIDDAYNSNPAGSDAALATLSQFKGYVKILITPGMIELGSEQFNANMLFGQKAALIADYAALVGPEQTRPIAAGLHAGGLDSERVRVCTTLKEALNFADNIEPGKPRVILLENDLPDNY